MDEGGVVTAWDPEKGSAWGAAVFYGLVYTAVVSWVMELRGWLLLGVLLGGYALDAAVARRLYAPVEYTLTEDTLRIRGRSGEESVALTNLTRVERYYRVNVGDAILIEAGPLGWDLLETGSTIPLLKALGPRLVELGIDRKVIASETTRQHLGLAALNGARDRLDSSQATWVLRAWWALTKPFRSL